MAARKARDGGFAVVLTGEGEGNVRLVATTAAAWAATGRADPALYRPHLSLGVFSTPAGKREIAAAKALAEGMKPVALRLASLGAFPSLPGTLFAAPVVAPSLLVLHERFLAAFEATRGSIWPYYEAGAWVPHVTLVHPAGPEDLARAMLALAPGWSPVDWTASELAVVALPSQETKAAFALKP